MPDPRQFSLMKKGIPAPGSPLNDAIFLALKRAADSSGTFRWQNIVNISE